MTVEYKLDRMNEQTHSSSSELNKEKKVLTVQRLGIKFNVKTELFLCQLNSIYFTFD